MTRLDWEAKQFKDKWDASTGPFKLSVRHDKINGTFHWRIKGFEEIISGNEDLPILAMERAEERLMQKLMEPLTDLFKERRR